MRDKKHVLRTNSSNVSGWGNQPIKKKKMCGSQALFSLYSEMIMWNLERYPGIGVGGHNVNNLRFTDQTVLIAENKESVGIEYHSKKTVLVIS